MQHLFFCLLGLIDAHLVRQIQFLKVENGILRSRLGQEVHTRPNERRRLLQFGLPLGKAVKNLISIVSYRTFRRWVRAGEGDAAPRHRRGRPRKPEQIEQLVVRMGRENAWGYSRILAELKKLNIRSLCRNTVKNILKRYHLDPGPQRGEGTWDQFTQRHLSTLWACDIFTQPVWTVWGRVDYFVLFFLEVGTRKIRFLNLTTHPNAEWMAQQARNFLMVCQKSGLRPGHLLHDRDSKFTLPFDDLLASEGFKPKRLPYKSPNLNPYAESWVGTIRRECLDHFLVLGERHLRYLATEYVDYYNTVRPHGSMGGPLEPVAMPTEGEVFCESRLGGLLKHYYRKAA